MRFTLKFKKLDKVFLNQIMIFLFCLIKLSFTQFCSEIDIGTDTNNINNVVKNGKVQPGWSFSDTVPKFLSSQTELYFYIRTSNLLTPNYDLFAFAYEKSIFMNVTLDETAKTIWWNTKVYKVIQKCENKDTKKNFYLNMTFYAKNCEFITITWIKTCEEPFLRKKGLFVKLAKNSADVVVNGAVTSNFDENMVKSVFTVFEEEKFTKFYFFNKNENKTFYSKPFVLADLQVMDPTITGNMATAGWIENDPLELIVYYNCLINDGKKNEVVLIIEIPYFASLEIHYFKVCANDQILSTKANFYLLIIVIIIIAMIGWFFKFCLIKDLIWVKKKWTTFIKEIKSSMSKNDSLKDSSTDARLSKGKNENNQKFIQTKYGTV